MSLIFDALQRAEAEHSGVDSSALSAATEVLRLAELRAASKQVLAVQAGQPGAMQATEQGKQSQLPARPQDAPAVEAHPAAVVTPKEEDADVFAQFQSLSVSTSAASRLVCLIDNESIAAEKFRFLGVSLQNLRRSRQLRKVLITSTIPQEGKSLISANLACALARRTQQKTLLIEGDVRRPSLSEIFELESSPGICEFLRGERDLTKSVYRLEGPGLWFLPAGSAPNNPLELLQSGRLSAMLDQLTAWFDWIIIDSPPVMPMADTSVWMRWADGVLLVVRQGITEKRQLQKGLDTLEPHKLIGALLNGSKAQARYGYYSTKVPSITPRVNDRSTD
jgi:capsular exopolysaccharide synthesis family protein